MANRYILPALTVVALMAGPAFARAAQPDPDAPRLMKVPYADLDLSKAKDQATLRARIHRAADAVCGPEPELANLDQYGSYRSCMKQATDAATAAIPGAELAKGRSGGPPATRFSAPP